MMLRRIGGFWNVRLTLYQWLMVCSLAAAYVLNHSLDNQLAELRVRRDSLFAMDHDLYIEDPTRLALVNKPIDNYNELCWEVYVPPKVQVQLVTEDGTLRTIPAGEHSICLQVDREAMMAKQLSVDEEPIPVAFKIDSFFSPALRAPATSAVGEPLQLLEGKDGKATLWMESSSPP